MTTQTGKSRRRTAPADAGSITSIQAARPRRTKNPVSGVDGAAATVVDSASTGSLIAAAVADAVAIVAEPPAPADGEPATDAGRGAVPDPAAAIEAVRHAPKPRTVRRVRQSCRLTDDEYARLGALKKRAASLARPMKRGELLRAGLHVLLRMPDDALFRALDALPDPPAG